MRWKATNASQIVPLYVKVANHQDENCNENPLKCRSILCLDVIVMASQVASQTSPSPSDIWPIILLDTKVTVQSDVKVTHINTIPVSPSQLMRHIAIMITSNDTAELELVEIKVFSDGTL